jgi:hypothetical protein
MPFSSGSSGGSADDALAVGLSVGLLLPLLLVVVVVVLVQRRRRRQEHKPAGPHQQGVQSSQTVVIAPGMLGSVPPLAPVVAGAAVHPPRPQVDPAMLMQIETLQRENDQLEAEKNARITGDIWLGILYHVKNERSLFCEREALAGVADATDSLLGGCQEELRRFDDAQAAIVTVVESAGSDHALANAVQRRNEQVSRVNDAASGYAQSTVFVLPFWDRRLNLLARAAAHLEVLGAVDAAIDDNRLDDARGLINSLPPPSSVLGTARAYDGGSGGGGDPPPPRVPAHTPVIAHFDALANLGEGVRRAALDHRPPPSLNDMRRELRAVRERIEWEQERVGVAMGLQLRCAEHLEQQTAGHARRLCVEAQFKTLTSAMRDAEDAVMDAEDNVRRLDRKKSRTSLDGDVAQLGALEPRIAAAAAERRRAVVTCRDVAQQLDGVMSEMAALAHIFPELLGQFKALTHGLDIVPGALPTRVLAQYERRISVATGPHEVCCYVLSGAPGGKVLARVQQSLLSPSYAA